MASEEKTDSATLKDTDPSQTSEGMEKAPKKYTKLFFQRPLSYNQANTFVFFHFMAVGLIQGYYYAVQFNLQSNGATFEQQSAYSLGNYPYILKFLLAPFLDRYFFPWLGRSKTYVILGGMLIGAIFMFLGPTIQVMISELEVGALAVLFTAVNVIVCIVQMSAESWILTLYSNANKTKATAFMNAGQILGGTIGNNVFTPLNDTEWLNENWFPNNPRTSPLVTHSMFCFAIAIFYMAQAVVNLLFISEELIVDKKAKNICNILKIVPRHFTNRYVRNLIFYIYANRFIYFMVDSAFDLKLVKNGYYNISRSVLSNIDMGLFPIAFATSLLLIYYLRKGILVKMFHLNMLIILLNGGMRYLTYLNLTLDRSYYFALAGRIFTSLIAGSDFTVVILSSFFNTFVNEALGNTGITCLLSLTNQTIVLARTLGFALLAYINFDVFAIVCIVLQILINLGTYKFTRWFDRRDSRYFDISEPEVKDGDLPNDVDFDVKKKL